jgi:hypothetical protein
MAEVTRATIKALAKSFIERSTELGYKGKKRDSAALDYFIGAAKLLEIDGDEEAANYLGRLAWLISIRGYKEVEEIAKWDAPGTFVIVEGAGTDKQTVIDRDFKQFTAAWAAAEAAYTQDERAKKGVDVMRVADDGSLTTEY